MSDKLFGTDGVRGKANVFPMTVDFVLKLGMALGKTLKSGAKVAIAKDTRISGDMLEASLTAGLTSMGIDVLLLGVMPTPAAAMLTSKLGVQTTIVISASHNPYFDNGIKLIKSDGHKYSDEMTAALENLIAQNHFDFDAETIGKVERREDALNIYLDKLFQLKKTDAPLKGLRVVLDCAHGAFSSFAPHVLKSFGAEVFEIGVQPNGYNINKDCGSTATALMSQTVLENKADIGIALDGDGDRIIVCDEKGQRIDGDQLIAFLSDYLNQNGRLKGNAVVATIWSNLGLEKFVASKGMSFYRTAVGERYVTEKMIEIGANFGGEESGHMVLSDFTPTGDGLLTGILLCLGILSLKKKMSDIFPVFEKCPCLIQNFRFNDREKVDQVMKNADVCRVIEEAKQKMLASGSVIVRKSGTEPLIKVRVESENALLVEEVSQMIKSEISKFV